MGNGVNKVILIGHVGRTPVLRSTTGGGAVTDTSIATSVSWRDKTTGEKREETEWHNIVLFKGLAEAAAKYLKKGSKVYIEGYLKTEKYQDKATGADRYSTKIIAQEMQFLDGKDSRSTDDTDQTDMKEKPKADNFEDFDDEIPF